MKGVVFTEFTELVEETFSMEIMDDIIDECDLPSGGAYTSVGFYDHKEILALVTKLSEKTGVEVSELLLVFGRHLIKKFSQGFPSLFSESSTSLDFLETIDNHIHVEVKKLYPDAELPGIGIERLSEHKMKMHYKSKRPFADLAYGLMMGAIDYFNDDVEVERQAVKQDGTEHIFILTRNP